MTSIKTSSTNQRRNRNTEDKSASSNVPIVKKKKGKIQPPQHVQDKSLSSNNSNNGTGCTGGGRITETCGLDTGLRPSGQTADWDDYLTIGYNLHFIPQVSIFKNAPLANIWEDIAKVGLKVEIPNPFIRCPKPINWIATTRYFAGYKTLVEFDTFGKEPAYSAWLSFWSSIPQPIGFSDKERVLLYPPLDVAEEHPKFLEKIRNLVRDSETISPNHWKFVQDQLQKMQKWSMFTMVEVPDKRDMSRMRIGTVAGLVGSRIYVTFANKVIPDNDGEWFDGNSEDIHPVGWSRAVGNDIYDVDAFEFKPLKPEYFQKYRPLFSILENQMFEARHPVRPYRISGAQVRKVLKYGYFVAEFRNTPLECKFPTTFTFHVNSPFLLPCGFCSQNQIQLDPPFGYKPESFSWTTFLENEKLEAMKLHLLPKPDSHFFKAMMKLEASGILDRTYLGPATIKKVVDHLLYLRFDGWPTGAPSGSAGGLADGTDIEFWTHAESTEIYPIGYAEMIGHNFQGRVEPNIIPD